MQSQSLHLQPNLHLRFQRRELRVQHHMRLRRIVQLHVQRNVRALVRLRRLSPSTPVSGPAPGRPLPGSTHERRSMTMEYLGIRLTESSKRSAVRILAAFLFALLAVAGETRASAAVPDEGRTIVVDGHRVAVQVVGRGRPAIVLISGLGDGMATFQAIARDLGKTHTVLLYDRAGYGGSDPGSGPRDAYAAERELSGILSQSGVDGPFILLGHSLGGLFAEYYAAKHPDQVSGLILEDSRPADFTRRCTIALGASKCQPPAWSTWLMPKGARGEVAALEQVMTQVEGSVPLHGKPVLALSRAAAKTSPFDALWTQAQDALAARYPGSRHLTAEAGGHYIHRDQRDWFLVSVRAFLNEVE